MNSSDIIKIFSNLGFKLINDSIFGTVIEMTEEDAYLLSATTGAKYLFYENGITMKGRSEVFIHRAVFSDGYLIYSPGLFSRDINGLITEGNSANVLKNKYPIVFNNKKKIIIFDIENGIKSNIEKMIYEKIKANNGDPSEYVLYKNFLSNIVGESLQEYFASLFFINKGYLVENQTPWFQQNYHFNGRTLQGGIPDFSAFHSGISNLLFQNSFIFNNKGLSLCILPVIKLFRKNLFKENPVNDVQFSHELIVGEAKTSKTSLPQALKQLKKYDAVQLADELFTIIPNSQANPFFGSMYIEDNKVIYNPKNKNTIKDERKFQDGQWIDTYIKMLLLGNVKFELILEFISNFRKEAGLNSLPAYESNHLLDAVQNTPNEIFMSFLKEAV